MPLSCSHPVFRGRALETMSNSHHGVWGLQQGTLQAIMTLYSRVWGKVNSHHVTVGPYQARVWDKLWDNHHPTLASLHGRVWDSHQVHSHPMRPAS